MTHRVRRTVFIAVAVIALVVVVALTSRDRPLAVTVARAAIGQVESSVANTRAGSVKACRRARMSPPSGGQIARLPVHEGARVRAGQILLELWNDDLAAQLKLTRSESRAARAQAEQACLVAANADTEARRQQTLRRKGLASEESVDRASTTARAQQASCEAARAQAQVSAARVEVATAQLERTRLRAPFDGTVAEVNGELGEFVTPSPTGVPTLPAVDLVDNSCLYISAPIDEVDAPAVRPGMDARISLDAFPGRSFPGIVQRVAPYVLEMEKQARTVDVETVFTRPDDFAAMLPGYSADTEIILAVRNQVLRIPTEAVLEGNRVLLYHDADGLLQERQIDTGLSNWRYTEVVAGLQAGDRVVTSLDREGVTAGVHALAESAP